MPSSLAALARAAPASRRPALRALLAGGDRRSLAESKAALTAVLADPGRVAELALLAEDEDGLVSMRALDLLEKIAHLHADWMQPHRRLLIGALADSDRWEVRLQIVRALPLMTWHPRERRRAVEILLRDVEHPQKFVRAWALDGLAFFAQHDAALRPAVEAHLGAFERSGSKALAVRARHIRDALLGGKGGARREVGRHVPASTRSRRGRPAGGPAAR